MNSSVVRTVIVAVALLAAPLAAQEPPGPKLARIGILTLSTASWGPDGEAFRQGLREHGYVEGRNITLEHRDAAGRADRLPALAGELVRLKVDVIVTQSNVAALAAKQATRAIPIVMAIAGDAVKAGVMASLASPGGNVTGLTLMQTDLSRKRLQLLREAVSNTTLVAVMWEAGRLLSYAPSLAESWRRAAVFVDKILSGAKPGDLPIEQPFELVVNLRTAGALGLTIPASLLSRTDEVIQ